MKSLRQSTLETLGLGTVLDIFRRGTLPVSAGTLAGAVFGNPGARGSLVISGANGIAGAGKTMQLGSRLIPYGITIVGLDIAGAPDGIGRQYQALAAAFGQSKANEIMSGIVRLNYDGRTLPAQLHGLRPRFLLEAIPEILAVKKAHYAMFHGAFPDIEIRSVTSGFPSAELGVGIAHPSFPHEVNKVWEIVERSRSDFTHLLWAIGLIPIPVSDHWSFVLDVLFCGLTLAALRYHRASNMPFWKIDKFVRRALGPNPFRAHNVIGARGANFLTWSCLQHLSEKYGPLFAPGEELEYRKTSGQDWYPPDHFRPVVNWSIPPGEEEELLTWLLGPILQMTSLMLHERRAHLSHINAIGELCAQFRRGILALVREMGPEAAIKHVEAYHRLYPAAAGSCWHPDVFGQVEQPSWQQLYVNAEHDGSIGVITISRESYNSDIDAELNRAIDWLKSEQVAHVIVTSDFHLSTQMVGADTADFYSSLKDAARGTALSVAWSETARRLHSGFAVSVGFVAGKRCLGGMLELLMHCHYLIAREDSALGMPEVTLPVIPGMEGCHWSLRKVQKRERHRVLRMLLTGESVRAAEAAGWLVDYSGPLDLCLQKASELVTPGNRSLPVRPVIENAIDIDIDTSLPPAQNALAEAARKAVADCIRASCAVSLAEALGVQARHSGAFMAGELCRSGVIGSDANRVLAV